MYYTLLRSEDLLNSEAGEGVYAPDQSGEHDKESKSDQCVLNHFLGSGPDHLFNLGNHLAWETNYGSGRATFRLILSPRTLLCRVALSGGCCCTRKLTLTGRARGPRLFRLLIIIHS